MTEVPWFSSPPDAKLVWGNHLRPDLGYLHFIDPEGRRAVVWVSRETPIGGEAFAGANVWHIDIDGTVATVSPSIHFIGHFHSPRPVTFHLVDDLTTVPRADHDPEEAPMTPDDYRDPEPLSGIHEQAVGVECDPSVLAAPPPGAPAPVEVVEEPAPVEAEVGEGDAPEPAEDD